MPLGVRAQRTDALRLMSNSESNRKPDRQRAAGRNVIRALAGFVALLIVGAGAAFGLNAWQGYTNEIDRVMRANVSIAHTLEEQTARSVQSIDLVLSGLADFFQMRSDFERPGSFAIYELLRRRLSPCPPSSSSIIILDRNGSPRLSHRPSQHRADRPVGPRLLHRAAQRPHAAAEGLEAVLRPARQSLVSSVSAAASSMTMASPAGVVVGVLSPDYFIERYGPLRPPGGAVELFLHDGTYLARAPHMAGLVGQSAEHSDLFQDYVPSRRIGSYEAQDRDGSNPRLVAYRVFADQPLVIQVSASLEDGRSALAAQSRAAWRHRARDRPWLRARRLRAHPAGRPPDRVGGRGRRSQPRDRRQIRAARGAPSPI